MKRSFWNRDVCVFIPRIQEDETISFKSVYALLHLLILRSITPSSQENQGMFPQTWHLLCSYTHIYFAHFVTIRLRSGPCINDTVWYWCELYRSHLLSLSLKFRFLTDCGSQTEPVQTVSLPVVDVFHFNRFVFSSWKDFLIRKCLKSDIKRKSCRRKICTLAAVDGSES